MICEIVTFPAPSGGGRDKVLADARSVVARWQGEPELVRKHFVLSEDHSTLKGIYLWKSRAAAEKAHDAAWRKSVEERCGTQPDIAYFDAFMIIDNDAGTVTEFPVDEAAFPAAAE